MAVIQLGNGKPQNRKGRTKAILSVAASLAATGLLAQRAHADGTATAVLTGDRTWNATGVWTWTGDTGNQVFPGDGVGPGAGTEAVIAQALYGTRNLNISTAAATNAGGFTIGSFTYQQAQNAVARQLNVNYQGTTSDPKFVLNTSLIQHIDAPGVVSSGGGNGLVNELLINNRMSINGGDLIVNSNPSPNSFWNSNLNFTGNIAIKFDDSDVSFTSLTLRGTKAFEIEDNLNPNAVGAIWSFSGPIKLEGTGQLRIRYNSTATGGDIIPGTSGLTQLVANAPNGGLANALFERGAGSVVNRIAFTDTVLNSDLFYDPNNTHVSLGNVQVNGSRFTFIWDGSTTSTSTNGSDYSNITGDANSSWLLGGGGTWTYDKNVQSTMLGKVGVYDYQANFNANGAMGAVGVADKYGMIALGVTPTATDKFEIKSRGIIRGNDTQLGALDVNSNITLQPGAVIAHTTFGASAATTTTIQNLPTTGQFMFGLGADTPTSGSFDITVGNGTPWAGASTDRSARRWNTGIFTANNDFTLQGARQLAGGQSLIMGNGTNAGGISVVNNTGSTGRVNVNLVGRVDFDDDASDYSNVNFIVNNQSEARFYRLGAMGSATATVMSGGMIIASSAQNGGSSAFNGNILIKTGGGIQINSKDITGANAGLSGSGTITREPNIIVWLNTSEAINGPQFGPANIQDGDLIRVEASDIKRFEELPGGVIVQVKNATRTFANGFTLDGGALVTDHASRIADTSAAGVNLISVGPKGATFAASTPTLTYVDPKLPPLLYNGSGNVGAFTGTNTLTVNMGVRANAAAIAAGPTAGAVTIGSATPIDGLNMMGHVIFNGPFVTAGNVNKISLSDLIFNNPETVIGGDLIAGGGTPGFSPNVKFGNNLTTLTDSIVSGSAIAGSLILGSGTKTDLNIATPNNNGLAEQSTGRLDVNLKIVVDGAMTPDGRRIYVDRRDATAGTFGLINLDKVTIRPGAFLSVDEANTDVRIKNPVILGDFTTDRGSGDAFDIENLNPATPITITHGVVNSTQGANIADIGLFGTTSSNVTMNNIRGQVRLEDGAVFNGVINTQNVPTGGDSWVRIFGGQTGTGFVSGTGQINMGGTANGSGAIGNGEDFYVYVNDDPSTPITNTVPLQVNVLANQFATIVSDRGTSGDIGLAGTAVVNNIHMQNGSTLYLGQNQDSTLVTDLILEGNATLKKNDGDATANQVFVRNVSGAFDLAVETGSANRALTFNGNVTNNRVVLGVAGNSAVQLNTGANLPSLEAGNQGYISVPLGQSATVARIKSTNTTVNAVDVSGTLQIRPTATDATSTTSKVNSAALSISGTLDIGAYNRVAIDYAPGSSPLVSVRNQIISGYASGAWNGPGIITSSALTDARLAVGYGEASEIVGATGGQFGSETVDGDTVLLRTTFAGDSNLSGKVDFTDLVALAQNYNADFNANPSTDSWWTHGDFNYDGKVDFTDLVKLAQNYNAAIPTDAIPGAPVGFGQDLAAAFAAVPEPSTAGLALIAACGLAAQRRRRKQ